MESANEHSQSNEKSPGQQLRELREAAGLSLAYVAEQMNLTEFYIASLEADEFAKLPSDPYVLGYYRTYARLLNISPQPLISSYRKLRQLPDETPVLASGSGTTRTASDLYRKPMVLDRNTRLSGKKKGAGISLYVIVAVILVAIWILVSLLAGKTDTVVITAPEGASLEIAVPGNTGISAVLPTDSEQPETSGEPLPQAADELDVEVPGQTAVDTPEPLAAETDETQVGGTEFAATVEPVAPAVAEVRAPALDRLSFVFSGECWLEVTDANGDILAATLYQEGDSAQLAGVAPFEIMLGNVRAAQLQLNGEAVALRALDNRKTLRMTLDKPKSATAE